MNDTTSQSLTTATRHQRSASVITVCCGCCVCWRRAPPRWLLPPWSSFHELSADRRGCGVDALGGKRASGGSSGFTRFGARGSSGGSFAGGRRLMLCVHGLSCGRGERSSPMLNGFDSRAAMSTFAGLSDINRCLICDSRSAARWRATRSWICFKSTTTSTMSPWTMSSRRSHASSYSSASFKIFPTMDQLCRFSAGVAPSSGTREEGTSKREQQ
mmetsp:Transcript_127/g.469  ORF Transcript_127/g.469 Transcript_127/m.469 type:complete len:215 (-) Transcript_127:385-1029(-)